MRTSRRCLHGAVVQLRQLLDPLLQISSGDLVARLGGGFVPGSLATDRLASVQLLAHHPRESLLRAMVELFGFSEQRINHCPCEPNQIK